MPLTTKSGDVDTRVFDVPDLPNAPDDSTTPGDSDERDLTQSIADREQVDMPVGEGSTTLDPVTGGPLPSLPAYVGDASVYQVGLYFAQLASSVADDGQVAFNATVLGLASGATAASMMEITNLDREGNEHAFQNAVIGDELRFSTPRGGMYRIVLTADATEVDGVVTLTGNVTFWVSHVEAVETVNVGFVGRDLDTGGTDVTPMPGPFDPADHTPIEVMDYVTGLGAESDPAVIAETQRVKDSEVAGLNRSGLVMWLAARDGVV